MPGGHAAHAQVTSARLHYEARELPQARHAAETALALDCSLGNEVLADLLSAQASGGVTARAQAVQAAAELRGTVERSDLVAYYGTYSATGEALAAAFAAQRTKTTQASSRVRSAAAKMSGEMPQQRRSDEGRD
jgi:hypothetical protein